MDKSVGGAKNIYSTPSHISLQLCFYPLSFNSRYLGRKRLKDDEDWVTGSTFLVHPGYSYWTLGYLISYNGARKLLSQDPLSKLVPVDEYLPIMFDRHPEYVQKLSLEKRFPCH